MAGLKDLERDLARALEAGDLDQLASVRRLIVEQHPESPTAGEAGYKLGLDALFRRGDLAEAAERFRAASKLKGPWAIPARTSLGIVLAHQGKAQQGMFELRKVAAADPPTLASVQAWGLIVIALREAKQSKEAERARGEQRKALQRLAADGTPEERAFAHFLLGIEHKFDGERDLAKKHLTAAVQGTALPEQERALATAALAEV